MRLRIHHATTYEYASPVDTATQVVRLTPRNDFGQVMLNWEVRASATLGDPSDAGRPRVPIRAQLVATEDGYGNRVHLLSVASPHRSTRLVAGGVVETSHALAEANGGTTDLPLSYWLRETPHARAASTIQQFIDSSGFRPEEESDWTPSEHVLERMMHDVRARIDFTVGATHVLTTADEAMARGAGVCQDHAHALIAVARALGIPARYVSGYMWPGHDHVVNASHAWVDLHVPGRGWMAFDPANDCRPGDAYVRVAIGLDYFDASPTRGVRQGTAIGERMDVQVEIYPVDPGPLPQGAGISGQV